MSLFALLFLRLVVGIFGGKQGRIVGGYEARIKDFPYMVSVQVFGRHQCGGALIKPNYVVTAAHCYIPGLRYVVKAGVDDLQTEGVESKVLEVTTHPQYNNVLLDYDVAVMKLETPLKCIPGKIQMVRLPDYSDDVPLTWGKVIGWGETYNVKEKENKLRALNLEVYRQEVCEDVEMFQMMDSMFCAGHFTGVKDSCNGDSGGPFVIGGTLYGVVSHGSKKCAIGFPGVYTKIPFVVNWIKEVANC
ncbi:trypsin 3A1-like isoform X2 [Coccinella septempunctata]|uniref:trypsin 3A1-like isoform X2 n=1 Tax=Coccinella septempunctata TaxID=41139 RepID=UPI001D05D1A8|nr:trypsin 3A1-like isoform X2 [Coccinella septempunctata]